MSDVIDDLLKGIENLPLGEGNMRVAKAIRVLNDNIFELKGRITVLEQKPDIASIRTMRDKIDALEREIKWMQSEEAKRMGGAAWG